MIPAFKNFQYVQDGVAREALGNMHLRIEELLQEVISLKAEIEVLKQAPQKPEVKHVQQEKKPEKPVVKPLASVTKKQPGKSVKAGNG